MSQNHTGVIPSTKCISSNALRESAVIEMNYSVQESMCSLQYFVDQLDLALTQRSSGLLQFRVFVEEYMGDTETVM